MVKCLQIGLQGKGQALTKDKIIHSGKEGTGTNISLSSQILRTAVSSASDKVKLRLVFTFHSHSTCRSLGNRCLCLLI